MNILDLIVTSVFLLFAAASSVYVINEIESIDNDNIDNLQKLEEINDNIYSIIKQNQIDKK